MRPNGGACPPWAHLITFWFVRSIQFFGSISLRRNARTHQFFGAYHFEEMREHINFLVHITSQKCENKLFFGAYHFGDHKPFSEISLPPRGRCRRRRRIERAGERKYLKLYSVICNNLSLAQAPSVTQCVPAPSRREPFIKPSSERKVPP